MAGLSPLLRPAPLAALRETGMVTAVLIGAVVLKERVTPLRAAAVAGVLAGAALLIQIVTGVTLAMNYAANGQIAFDSVERITEAYDAAKGPLLGFLKKHAAERGIKAQPKKTGRGAAKKTETSTKEATR